MKNGAKVVAKKVQNPPKVNKQAFDSVLNKLIQSKPIKRKHA
jgi:hypothetical protein